MNINISVCIYVYMSISANLNTDMRILSVYLHKRRYQCTSIHICIYACYVMYV